MHLWNGWMDGRTGYCGQWVRLGRQLGKKYISQQILIFMWYSALQEAQRLLDGLLEGHIFYYYFQVSCQICMHIFFARVKHRNWASNCALNVTITLCKSFQLSKGFFCLVAVPICEMFSSERHFYRFVFYVFNLLLYHLENSWLLDSLKSVRNKHFFKKKWKALATFWFGVCLPDKNLTQVVSLYACRPNTWAQIVLSLIRHRAWRPGQEF